MARGQGNQKPRSPERGRKRPPDAGGRRPALPDFVRRALSLGFSGFFLTEEAVRRAFGDAVPREWADFAAEQSERARTEFLERLSFEIAQSIDKLDVAAVLQQLLEGRTLEVRAEIRLGPPEAGRGRHSVRAELRDSDPDA
jgi:hypothetical protein